MCQVVNATVGRMEQGLQRLLQRVGRRIAELRSEQGATQAEFAEKLEISVRDDRDFKRPAHSSNLT